MERIGVRELRQHASRYLERVAAGENFEVTDRGRPVALLVPVPGERWQQMLAAGQVLAPEVEGSVLDEPPLELDFDASARLAALRDLER
jgi:prevent-host-death family protein